MRALTTYSRPRTLICVPTRSISAWMGPPAQWQASCRAPLQKPNNQGAAIMQHVLRFHNLRVPSLKNPGRHPLYVYIAHLMPLLVAFCVYFHSLRRTALLCTSKRRWLPMSVSTSTLRAQKRVPSNSSRKVR